jgi:hypothetical protein
MSDYSVTVVEGDNIQVTVQNQNPQTIIVKEPVPPTIITVATVQQGPSGPQGESFQETFETVSKNLKSYPYALNYISGKLTSIVYTLPVGSITKTLNYTSGILTSIVLSGDTPSGIDLTKTLTYSGSVLTGVAYS